jgi:undecaprenyl-diphosphatase
MSPRGNARERTPDDVLAKGVALGSGAVSVVAEPLDRAVYKAVAATSTPVLDGHFRQLSRVADHSVLWLGIAAGLAVVGGRGGSAGDWRHVRDRQSRDVAARSWAATETC